MKLLRLSILISASMCIATSAAQSLLQPGSTSFDKKKIKNGTYEMVTYLQQGSQQNEISTFTIEINSNNSSVSVFTTLSLAGSTDQWMDTTIADINTLKPVYRSSFNRNREMVLKFDKNISGYYYDKKLNNKNTIKEANNGMFFDNYLYPYLLGLLPLQSGYKADFSVYDYKPENKSNIKKTRIEEVKSNVYNSTLSGKHEVWQVSVFEESSNEMYQYYIDKESRRIWKIEIASGSRNYLMIDRENDFNPFKNKFNQEETLALIKSGNSTIRGEVFARDNENEGVLGGMAVLNVNPKQFAPTGTTVLLIPYTPFFKEWIKLNEDSRKKGYSVPLPKEAAACIKVTSVYDDKGSFEFTNLKPADFLLYTEFGYLHTTTHTEVIGYTDTYINGIFQGSTANTTSYQENVNAAATIKKTVTIQKPDEIVTVKLKKTL